MAANKRGTPDILAVIAGRFVAIEVKAPGGRVSKLQVAQLKRIEAAGGIAILAESLEDVTDYLATSGIEID